VDVYHGIRYSWHTYIPVQWRASKSSPVAATTVAAAAAAAGLSIRECVSPGNRYSRLRKHLRHDLIVSAAAVYTARTRTRTHSYARHSCTHARTWRPTCVPDTHTRMQSVLYARWVRACVRRRVCAYVCPAREERKTAWMREGRWREEERSVRWKLPGILETTRISLSATYEYWCTFLDGRTAPRSLVSIRETIIFPSIRSSLSAPRLFRRNRTARPSSRLLAPLRAISVARFPMRSRDLSIGRL